jgi:hypothetical protein
MQICSLGWPGEMKIMLPGHKRSVLCLDIGMEMFVTGGAEGDVRVWTIQPVAPRPDGSAERNIFRRVRCTKVE